MRHRIKKTYSVQKDAASNVGSSGRFCTKEQQLNQLYLHSDKGTCFGKLRKGFFGKVRPESRNADGRSGSGPRRGLAIGGKVRKAFGVTIPLVVPAVSGLVFLLVLGGLVFPGMVEGAYAETDNADNIEPYANTPAISLTLPDYDDIVEQVNLQKQVTAEDNVGHLTIDFNVRASNIDKYDVYVQSTSSALIGEANGERVESINADTLYANMKNQAGWGYAVSKGSKVNAETLTYKPIQTGVNTSADTGSATNTTINQPYTLAFAANLSGVSADHYMSNVILSVAVGAEQTATLYSVTYNTNNSTAGTTPATQSAVSDSGTYSFTVPTAEQYGLAKEGYTFMGWADSPTAVFEQYKANIAINLSRDNPNLTLYAVWGKTYTLNYDLDGGYGLVPANETFVLGHLPYVYTPMASQERFYKPGYITSGWNSVVFSQDNPNPITTPIWSTATADNIVKMQEMTNAFCSVWRQGAQKELIDIRDGKKYWVARLKDNNCWMTQNLDIDLDNRVLTSDDSDVSSNWLSSTGPSSATFDTSNNVVKYYDPGIHYCADANCNSNTSSNGGHDAQGNYYSWVAAKAGSTDVNSSVSICPRGWQLPTGDSAGAKSFNGLLNGLVGGVIKESPYYYIYSGRINGNLQLVGTSGFYWSSTGDGTSSAYSLYYTSGEINTMRSNVRNHGYSVRCVAR